MQKLETTMFLLQNFAAFEKLSSTYDFDEIDACFCFDKPSNFAVSIFYLKRNLLKTIHIY